MRAICVFCGSSSGQGDGYLAMARAVGGLIARRGLTLVYGGGSIGLMGAVADAALAEGGRVVGVIPRALWEMEVGHHGLSDLHVVDSMHDRKAMMADLSDGFLVLPGGIGTMEEFFEVWTWGQLGIHAKPVGVLDCQGYYAGMFAFLDSMVEQGFLGKQQRSMVLAETDAERVLDAMSAFAAPAVARVLDIQAS